MAKKYGVSVAEIKKANGMTSDNLRAGQTIKIPAKSGYKSSSSKYSSKKSTGKRSKKRRR
ncbi:MAG: LysM peptidoglycan-binding domain-containing protein [Muribaculaceae bacterium]|nr:LysM peptidoglycan-binding domain-containing protein [Muribaculaceae bacterium]